MSRTVAPLAALMFAIVTAAAYGEESPPQRVLVPVYTAEPIPGVNGAQWSTDLWISNFGGSNATVDGILWDCFLEQCGPASVEPGVTFHTAPEADGLHGALLSLDPATSGTVGFSLDSVTSRDRARPGAPDCPWCARTPFGRASSPSWTCPSRRASARRCGSTS